MWVAAILCFAVSATKVLGFGYQEQFPLFNYSHEMGHSSNLYRKPMIVRPVSYTYFTSNLWDPLKSPLGARQIDGVPFDEQEDSNVEEEMMPSWRGNFLDLADNIREQLYLSVHQDGVRTVPAANKVTVRFPLNTVLPANSLTFDQKPYPGLLQAVNIFSDLTPSRKPDEALLVTHNTISLPVKNEGVTTASMTTITNHGTQGEGTSYPYREFTETTHNTRDDRGSLIERIQRLRVHQNLEDSAESFVRSESGHGSGATRDVEEGDHHESEDGKGEKGNKKDYKYHKELNGCHDRERNSEENPKKKKKYNKASELFGEQRQTEKEGKGKKYGGRKQEGYTTHGDHNVMKKDEFIKNAMFCDESIYAREGDVQTGQLADKKNDRKEEGEKGKNHNGMMMEGKKSHQKGH